METRGSSVPPQVRSCSSRRRPASTPAPSARARSSTSAARPVPARPAPPADPSIARPHGGEPQGGPRNAGATLYDIGDGVLLLEFHTKMNAVDNDIAAMLTEGVDLAEGEFAGLVIGNHAEHFCAGANLMLVLLEAQNKQFGNIDTMVKGFQDACMRLRYSASGRSWRPRGDGAGRRHRDVPRRRPDPRGGRDVHGTGRGGRGAAARRRGLEGDGDPPPRGDPGRGRRGPAPVPAKGVRNGRDGESLHVGEGGPRARLPAAHGPDHPPARLPDPGREEHRARDEPGRVRDAGARAASPSPGARPSRRSPTGSTR